MSAGTTRVHPGKSPRTVVIAAMPVVGIRITTGASVRIEGACALQSVTGSTIEEYSCVLVGSTATTEEQCIALSLLTLRATNNANILHCPMSSVTWLFGGVTW
eukprot:1176386-Prorocentrum_minimum.AAC.1